MKGAKFVVQAIIVLLLLSAGGCGTQSGDYQSRAEDPELYRRSVKRLSDVIVYDIFSPPVASRIYAYAAIAAYEAMAPEEHGYLSLGGQLHQLDQPPQPAEGQEYCYPVASLRAFLVVARELVFSEEKIAEFEEEIMREIRKMGIPGKVLERSLKHGEEVGGHILVWASKDNYKQTRTFPKYSVRYEPSYWKPTPPDYMEGIEPHWNKIRTMAIDSANQFVPPPPTPFSLDQNSAFYKEVMEVYEMGKNIDQDQQAIAEFWDCNPYVSHHRGHAMFATKKITPGGHWIGITAIATRDAGLDFIGTTEAFALTSIALFDAFIACWDEKWRSILVRPETVINQYIDEDWLPLLQTPPFPEYTSGHSVISAASATMLTHLLGENFQFIDSTEVEYGLGVRQFGSFREASDEAAISRMYGGIHYRPACENGVVQGNQVGDLLVSRLRTRPDRKPAVASKE
jgi:hypothetical protein